MQPKWVKHLKITSKFKIPYYYSLEMWFLGATRGKQGLAVVDI